MHKIIFFLVLVTVITSCDIDKYRSRVYSNSITVTPKYVNPYKEAGDQIVPSDQPYYITGLKLNNEIGLPSELGGVYWLKPLRPISATMLFTNGTPWFRSLKIICLIDYKQVPCIPQENTISVEVSPKSQEEISLYLPTVLTGTHTLDALALSYLPPPLSVINDSNQLSELISRSDDFFWHSHVVIYAGSYEKPSIKYGDFQYGESGKSNSDLLEMSITTISDTTSIIFPNPNFSIYNGGGIRLIKALPDQEMQFYILSKHGLNTSYLYFERQYNNNTNIKNIPIAVSAFINDQQIPMNAYNINGPIFCNIPINQDIIIPFSFKAPRNPGIYSVFIIYQEGLFNDRGRMIPQSDEGIIYESFPDILFPSISNRLLIEVSS